MARSSLLPRIRLRPTLLVAAAVARCSPIPLVSALVTMSASNAAASGAGGSLPLDRLSSHANAYASAHGIQVETKKTTGASGGDDGRAVPSSYQTAPVSLLPNAYPAAMFAKAKSLAGPFNELVDRISRDGPFLRETLGGDVSEADPFTGKLLELYEVIYLDETEDGAKQGKFAREADRFGIQRSDYMLNEPSTSGGEESEKREYELKQVELNTIAASFAGLAVNCAGMHRHLTSRFKDEAATFLGDNANAVMGADHVAVEGEETGVPENPALKCLPGAMHLAHERYVQRFGDTASKDAVVLFVVQEGETNTVDQRMLEIALWENHGVPVVRMSLTAAGEHLQLDEATGALSIKEGTYSPHGTKEVSAAYFRAGYAPTDYPDGYDGVEWSSRAKIERGRCAKCPSLGYHLAGTKKVQQELAREGSLERFFPSEREEGRKVEAMRGAFAGLYSLGSDATERDLDAIRDATVGGGHGRYVLKPQREGGGYNYYGQDLADKIKANAELNGEDSSSGIVLGKDLAEFILMERLFPPRQTAVLLRAGLVEGTGQSISELGCFGTILCDAAGQVVSNEYGGWILRTKFENVDEGGVASGFATLSSPYLC